MAKQPRKPAKPTPTTAHPLFPAVVALWFGALFGLGSLAVRPSLLESLVIRSRLDLVLPAAAPPLGITARILVALILAAIGSVIGVIIARRLSRPKVEVRERKRKTLATADEDVQIRRRDAHPDAPARRPLSASDDLAEAPGNFGGGVLAARRRSLAIEHEEQAFVPHEFAPLPGGSPQVLDIGSVGMTAAPDEAPLELGSYVAPATLGGADELSATAAALPPEIARQVFQSDAPAVTAEGDGPVDACADAHEAAQAVEAGHQVFGLTPQPPRPDASRQIFGQPIDDDHISQDFVKAAGFKTTVFETPEPTPLFAPRVAAPVPGDSELAAVVPPAPSIEPAAPFVPPFAAAERVPVPQAEALLPSPADLGMTDLASRLAESMARRRAARSAAPEAVAAPVDSEAEPSTYAPLSVEPATIPASFEPPVPTMPAAFAAAPAPVFAAPNIAVPAPEPAVIAPAGVDTIPAGLRPLDLDGFQDDDGAFASTLPPRHIAMPPAQEVSSLAEPAPAFADPIPAAPETGAEELAECEAPAEDSYGSLLGMSAPRAGMIRIEEPETELADIEPVVIFPGQLAHPTAASEEVGSFRRFDAPGSAEQGQPIAATSPTANVDREEADRALRMALANLQRMSGAA